jgi:hypothetical protein
MAEIFGLKHGQTEDGEMRVAFVFSDEMHIANNNIGYPLP